MLKRTIFYSFIFCFTSFMFCGRLQGAHLDVAGKWKYKDPQIAAPVTMTLYEDYTYELDTNGDTDRDIWGTYKIFHDQITFKDDEKSNSADICFEPGIYYYKVQKRDVRFELIADQCKYRAAALSYEWTKVKTKKFKEDCAYGHGRGCEEIND